MRYARGEIFKVSIQATVETWLTPVCGDLPHMKVTSQRVDKCLTPWWRGDPWKPHTGRRTQTYKEGVWPVSERSVPGSRCPGHNGLRWGTGPWWGKLARISIIPIGVESEEPIGCAKAISKWENILEAQVYGLRGPAGCGLLLGNEVTVQGSAWHEGAHFWAHPLWGGRRWGLFLGGERCVQRSPGHLAECALGTAEPEDGKELQHGAVGEARVKVIILQSKRRREKKGFL